MESIFYWHMTNIAELSNKKYKYLSYEGGVAEDQEVFLPGNGICKQINDVSLTDMIYSLNKKKITHQRVINKVDQGIKVIYEVNNRIQLTEDCLILTVSGYREVRNLKKSDILIKKGSYPKFGNQKMDIELSKIIGYLIGDGSMTRKWGVGEFINTNKDIVNDLSRLVQKYGCQLVPKNNNKTYYIVKENNLPRGSYRNPLRTLLDSVNLKRGNYYNKIIPSAFFEAEKESIIALTEGLWNADGYASKQGILGFGSTSKILCYQVKELLSRFKIVVSVKEDKTESSFGKFWKIVFAGKSNIEKFYYTFTLTPLKQIAIKKFIQSTRLSCSDHDWVPDNYIPMVKAIFNNGTKVSKIVGNKKRTGYPEWNKKERVKLTKQQLKRLTEGYEGYKYNKELEQLIDEDIYYEKVDVVQRIGFKRVFNLTMEKYPNFVVNDYIVHS